MWFEIALTGFLVLLNGFFVAAEFAIVKVRLSQLELLVKENRPFAKLSCSIVKHLDDYLAATQLGITLASLGLGWVGKPVVSKVILKAIVVFNLPVHPSLAHEIAFPIAFLFITMLHIVFGELMPKSIAIQRSQFTTLLIAYPLHIFYVVFKPFIFVLNGFAGILLKLFRLHSAHHADVHSSEELKYLVGQGKESGVLEEANFEIIKNAFDFPKRKVKQIMVPRAAIFGINIDAFSEKSLEKMVEENYSRIPCYEKNLDRIIGIVYLKEMLLAAKNHTTWRLQDLIHPVMTIPETKRIGPLLLDFQRKRQQIAIVIDEHGGTTGLVTMEDIIEELVGEIQDESDDEEQVVSEKSPGNYVIIATASLNDINKYLPTPFSQSDQYETLCGKLIYETGKIPHINQHISCDQYDIKILKKEGEIISLVQATLATEL
jgi:CBS domain containing-hemolysin-like protein